MNAAGDFAVSTVQTHARDRSTAQVQYGRGYTVHQILDHSDLALWKWKILYRLGCWIMTPCVNNLVSWASRLQYLIADRTHILLWSTINPKKTQVVHFHEKRSCGHCTVSLVLTHLTLRRIITLVVVERNTFTSLSHLTMLFQQRKQLVATLIGKSKISGGVHPYIESLATFWWLFAVLSVAS